MKINITTLQMRAVLFYGISVASIQARSIEPTEIYELYSGSIVAIECPHKDGEKIARGTGFAITQDGFIVTNQHVVADAQEIKVSRLKGSPVTATANLVASDKKSDLAIIRANIGFDREIPILEGDEKPGSKVTVIGNPRGLSNSISTGIVSAIRDDGTIQISAPISPGSSGSPVFAEGGELIGVATSAQTNGQLLNFAASNKQLLLLLSRVEEETGSLITLYSPKQKKEGNENSDEELVSNALYDSFIELRETAPPLQMMPAAEELVEKFPASAIANSEIASLHLKLGQTREALSFARKSLDLNPENPNSWLLLARIYSELDKPGLCVASALRAQQFLTGDPKRDLIILLPGIIQTELLSETALRNKLEASISIILSGDKSWIGRPEVEERIFRIPGHLYYLGDLAALRSYSERFSKVFPNTYQAHLVNAHCLYFLGESSKVRDEILKASEIQPSLKKRSDVYRLYVEAEMILAGIEHWCSHRWIEERAEFDKSIEASLRMGPTSITDPESAKRASHGINQWLALSPESLEAIDSAIRIKAAFIYHQALEREFLRENAFGRGLSRQEPEWVADLETEISAHLSKIKILDDATFQELKQFLRSRGLEDF